jgi:1,4-alpha-glucan branching enzyme
MEVNQASDNSMSGSTAGSIPNDGTGVVQLDPWLAPFKDSLRHRFKAAQDWIKTINDTEGGLDKFSRVGHYSCHLEILLTGPGLREIRFSRA